MIGGLNPDFLAPTAPVPHEGTTDVDLLFEVGFIFDRDELDFSWLDSALTSGGFTAGADPAWQWVATVDDMVIRLDLLCDVPDNPGQALALPGAELAATKNFIGPGPALMAPIERSLEVPASARTQFPGAPSQVVLCFANLGGYLLAKAAAIESRRLPKDIYDLMYVTLYNPGGAREAARVVRSQLAQLTNAANALQWIVSAIDRFQDALGSEAGIFAATMRRTGDESTDEQLRTDAAVAAQRFLAAVNPAGL